MRTTISFPFLALHGPPPTQNVLEFPICLLFRLEEMPGYLSGSQCQIFRKSTLAKSDLFCFEQDSWAGFYAGLEELMETVLANYTGKNLVDESGHTTMTS
jgi:hypothetical protein